MRAYYNDNETAGWLRNLVHGGIISFGDVDERGIESVTADDVRAYERVHLFAGIGGWDYALNLAGWPAGVPVWTGSCPCQPFSSAGKRGGVNDPRHLWPEFLRLIAECRPPVIFGEQVASPAGRAWLAGVRADLEALGYAVGAADLCAAGVGAPHIRQRLFWVADCVGERRGGWSHEHNDGFRAGLRPKAEAQGSGTYSWVADSAGEQVGRIRQPRQCSDHGAADIPESRLEGRSHDASAYTSQQLLGSPSADWGNTWLPFKDGRYRRVEPSIQLLADGIPARMAKLRGIGNAIVPQLAAEFVRAYIDTRQERG